MASQALMRDFLINEKHAMGGDPSPMIGVHVVQGISESGVPNIFGRDPQVHEWLPDILFQRLKLEFMSIDMIKVHLHH